MVEGLPCGTKLRPYFVTRRIFLVCSSKNLQLSGDPRLRPSGLGTQCSRVAGDGADERAWIETTPLDNP